MARRSKAASQVSARAAEILDSLAANVRAERGPLPFIATVACIVAAFVLLAVGVPRLRAYLDSRSMVSASEITVRFVKCPSWFDETRQLELRQTVANAVGDASALDPSRIAIAREAIAQSGWFGAIRQIELEGNGGFLIDADFRNPFAVVLHGDREHLIDDEGCRLPLSWPLGHRPAQPHWISLVHAAEPPPGEPGGQWRGRDIAAGIDLLKSTWQRRWETQIAAIDLSRIDSDGLVLMTRTGGFIVWGLPPSVTSTGEPPVSAKLRNLDHLFASTGHIDNGGGRIIDLRTDVPSVRLAANPAADGAGQP